MNTNTSRITVDYSYISLYMIFFCYRRNFYRKMLAFQIKPGIWRNVLVFASHGFTVFVLECQARKQSLTTTFLNARTVNKKCITGPLIFILAVKVLLLN